MITVNLLKKNRQIIGYEISGHAMFSRSGQDIVCAAVSFLAINTANAIESYCNNTPNVVVNDDEGYLRLIIDEELTAQSKLLLKTFTLGIKELQKQYNNTKSNLSISEKLRLVIFNKNVNKKYINITFEEV